MNHRPPKQLDLLSPQTANSALVFYSNVNSIPCQLPHAEEYNCSLSSADINSRKLALLSSPRAPTHLSKGL